MNLSEIRRRNVESIAARERGHCVVIAAAWVGVQDVAGCATATRVQTIRSRRSDRRSGPETRRRLRAMRPATTIPPSPRSVADRERIGEPTHAVRQSDRSNDPSCAIRIDVRPQRAIEHGHAPIDAHGALAYARQLDQSRCVGEIHCVLQSRSAPLFTDACAAAADFERVIFCDPSAPDHRTVDLTAQAQAQHGFEPHQGHADQTGC